MSSSPLKLNRRHVLIFSISLFVLLISLIEYQVLSYTDGVLVYPQDDAYIRMATAKNLAFNHVWGISKHEFSSASSSLLYPILLAPLYFLFGSRLIFSLIINLATGLLLIIEIQRWLDRQAISYNKQAVVLSAVVVLAPLPILTVIGMEHALQALISFLFIYKFCEWAAADRLTDKPVTIPSSILIWALAGTAIRYEGIFPVAVACLFLLARRKFRSTLALILVSSLPIIAFGVYSMVKGGYFLPNSIMIKALPVPLNGENIGKFFTEEVVNKVLFPYPTRGAIAAERILIVIPIAYWLFSPIVRAEREYRYLLIFCLGVCLLHLIFANAVFNYRYEAYLIVCVTPIVGTLLVKHGKSYIPTGRGITRWVTIWAGIVLLYPFLSRSWAAYKDTGKGCLNMYEQDYAAARFLHRYYNKADLVVDDIGAISYLTEGKKLDLNIGIANREIVKSREEEYYRPEYLDYFVKREQPAIAIVSENRYNPWLLQKWHKVASFHTYNTVRNGDRFICFYAVDSVFAPFLRKSVKEFESSLPPGVKADYY